MRAYDNYHAAYDAAISLARASGLDVGLAKGNEYGRTVFTVWYLPSRVRLVSDNSSASVSCISACVN